MHHNEEIFAHVETIRAKDVGTSKRELKGGGLSDLQTEETKATGWFLGKCFKNDKIIFLVPSRDDLHGSVRTKLLCGTLLGMKQGSNRLGVHRPCG